MAADLENIITSSFFLHQPQESVQTYSTVVSVTVSPSGKQMDVTVRGNTPQELLDNIDALCANPRITCN